MADFQHLKIIIFIFYKAAFSDAQLRDNSEKNMNNFEIIEA